LDWISLAENREWIVNTIMDLQVYESQEYLGWPIEYQLFKKGLYF
jgi:hypothetical protein